ncbi:MAG: hypothetical protein ABIG96_06705 [Candidatus Micrarchaeota archaeon]
MPKYLGAAICGQTTRSEKTAAAHRLFRDGNGPFEDFRKNCGEDADAYIKAQENFAFISGGQPDWLDLLRPLAHSFAGFSKRDSPGEDAIGPVTRWFRTNSFYRMPTVAGKIDCVGNELVQALPKLGGNGMLLILGPYSFSRMVVDTYYNDEKQLALDYAKAVAKNLPSLKNHGYSCILLLEPSIGYDQSKKKLRMEEWYKEVLGEFKKEGFALGVHLPLCDASEVAPMLENTPIDFIGIDCIYTSEKILTTKDLLFGIVDGVRAKTETAEEIKSSLQPFLEKAEFSGNYYAGTTDRLYDVPFNFALEKIRSLSSLIGKLK